MTRVASYCSMNPVLKYYFMSKHKFGKKNILLQNKTYEKKNIMMNLTLTQWIS